MKIITEVITSPEGIELLQTSMNTALGKTVAALTRDKMWLQSEPSPTQMFCFDFVNACCTKISIFSNRSADIQYVDWEMFNKYFSLIAEVGTLYFSYSKQDQTKLCDALPDVVARHPSSSVKRYFKWIQKFHLMLAGWKSRLQKKEANYEEINWYYKSHEGINKLAGAVAASSLVVLKKDVETLQDAFLEGFKKLNQLVLRYIPNDSKAGW